MNLINGKKLHISDMQNNDKDKRLLREIELICAVGELEALRSGATLYNDQLDLRIGDILVDMDDEVSFNCAGVFEVESSSCDAAKSIATMLTTTPRGTYVILKSMGGGYDGIPRRLGYDGWMSDGKGHLASHSGHKFTLQNKDAFRLSERSLYSQIWSKISYDLRNHIRSQIEKATADAAAAQFLGQKIARENYLRGISWTSITLEEILPDENRFAIKVTKRGASKRYKVDAAALTNLLPIVYTLPDEYSDPGNTARRLSLPEQRIAAAKKAWDEFQEQTGFEANTPLYDESFRVNGDRYTYGLKRTVSRNPYTYEDAGTFIVDFAPGTDTATYVDVCPPQSRAAA